MKYTKGPWRVLLAESTGGYPQIRADVDTRIANVGFIKPNQDGTTDGNAQLIAMAPKMYEALKSVQDILTSDEWGQGLRDHLTNLVNSALED